MNIVSSETPLVETKYSAINRAPVLHILQTVHKEYHHGNRTKKKAENSSHQKCKVAVYEEDLSGDLVAFRTHCNHWVRPKRRLKMKSE